MNSVRSLLAAVAFIGFCTAHRAALAQTTPVTPTLPIRPAVSAPRVLTVPANATPMARVRGEQGPSQLPSAPSLAAGILAFDSETKEAVLKPGEMTTNYLFRFTNVSPAEVTISRVHLSCGCTTTRLPAMPWKIPAGGTGEIPLTMNAQGRKGVLIKTLTVFTDKGQKTLMLKTTIPQREAQPMTAAERQRNQLLARADRQAVFKGDCARCHVEPVIGKFGHDLYLTACGICHEAEHRATMMPDLRNLPNPTSAEYWNRIITVGKEGTLMPAFSQAQGGPLSEQQIAALVDYLVAAFPAKDANSSALLSKP